MELTDAIQRFRGPLIGLIISWGTPHADAAEIAQDSFADAWLNRDNCRGDLNDPKVFGAWLRGIAKNRHRNWIRSRNRRDRRVSLVDSANLDVAAVQLQAADHDELTRLRTAIDRLPPKQKEVVMMHYLEETSVLSRRTAVRHSKSCRRSLVSGSTSTETNDGRIIARNDRKGVDAMTKNTNPLLMDENKIRAALQPFCTERAVFESAVTQRIEELKAIRASEITQQSSMSDLRRVAAAVMPPMLLGNSTATVTAWSVTKVSLWTKLIGLIALPAIGMFLMVGSTLFGLAKIRQAKLGRHTGDVDYPALATAQKQWWTKYGWLIGTVFAAALVSPFFGCSLIFPVLLASGVAMVSLVVSLGKAGVVDRQAIGRSFIAGLAQLAQLANIGVTSGTGIKLLDQSLITLTLFAGALVLATILLPTIGWEKPCDQFSSKWLWWPIAMLAVICPFAFRFHLLLGGMVLAVSLLLCLFACFTNRVGLATLCLGISFGAPLLLMMGWFGQSLNPVTQNTLKQYVETFDTAPHSSASWKQWEVVAAWLEDSGVQFDHSKPRRLLEAELNGEQNAWILKSAFRTGLIRPEDSIRLRDLNQKKNEVIYESDPTASSYESLRKSALLGKPILSLDQYDYVIRASIMTNQLSESERNLLETRLLATFRDIAKSEFHLPIQDALNVTQLLEVIGHSRHIDEFRPYIHGLLVDFQCLEYERFQSPGGFRGYPGIDTSDDDATTAAVELMQYYGVPKELDLVALRSFLRPTTHDRLKLSRSNLRGGVHKATLLRLESLPDVPLVTLWYYLRYELNLGAAILLVLLCCCATLSAPIRRLQGSATTARITPAG